MDFLDSLLGALSNVADQIAQAIAYLFSALIAVFQFLWAVIQVITGYLYQLLQDVGALFVHLWNNFFKGIFGAILKGIVAFGKWLHNIFGPVVKFLRNVSRYIDRIYNTYVRPILKWIRLARIFLGLLKALHIKWATKLDNILGTVQNDIQRGFLLIKGYLNVLIDLANILADPTNLLRRPTTLLSILRVSHAAIRMFTGLPPGFFIPSPAKGAALGLGPLPANFDPNNPLHNPPASYYLAFDGGVPSFEGLGPGETIDDTSIDQVPVLDFFNESLYPASPCVDPVQCLTDVTLQAIGGK